MSILRYTIKIGPVTVSRAGLGPSKKKFGQKKFLGLKQFFGEIFFFFYQKMKKIFFLNFCSKIFFGTRMRARTHAHAQAFIGRKLDR